MKWALFKKSNLKGLEAITGQILSICRQHHFPAAIAIAGDVDKNGTVIGVEHLGLTNYSPQQALRQKGHSGSVLCCINDATAACAGESNEEILAFLSVGTGIGEKVAIGNSVIAGHNGAAGEIGHVVLEKDGIPCLCGLKGCCEAYGGWAGLQTQWQGRKDYALKSPKHILEIAQAGDLDAQELVAKAIQAISRSAVCLIAAVNPARLVLGGGVTAAWGQFMVDSIAKEISEQCYVGKQTNVQASILKEGAALLGAAAVAEGAVFVV